MVFEEFFLSVFEGFYEDITRVFFIVFNVFL
jgi:hypothetical protein